jgi:hypothetical protein
MSSASVLIGLLMMTGFLRQLFDATRSLAGRAPLQVAGLASLCRGLRTGGTVAKLPTAALEAWLWFHLSSR